MCGSRRCDFHRLLDRSHVVRWLALPSAYPELQKEDNDTSQSLRGICRECVWRKEVAETSIWVVELRIRQVRSCRFAPEVHGVKHNLAETERWLFWNPSEVFVIVSLTLFLPICLEQFARWVDMSCSICDLLICPDYILLPLPSLFTDACNTRYLHVEIMATCSRIEPNAARPRPPRTQLQVHQQKKPDV